MTNTQTKTIKISGKTHGVAIEESSVPRHEGWPEPEMRRAGRGRVYVYVVDQRFFDRIRTHLEDIHSVLDGCGDPEGRADQRAIRRDLERMDRS